MGVSIAAASDRFLESHETPNRRGAKRDLVGSG
jgi:hypothetical protein